MLMSTVDTARAAKIVKKENVEENNDVMVVYDNQNDNETENNINKENDDINASLPKHATTTQNHQQELKQESDVEQASDISYSSKSGSGSESMISASQVSNSANNASKCCIML